MRFVYRWLWLLLVLASPVFAQEYEQGVFISAETGFLKNEKDHLVARLPIYTQLRVLQQNGDLLKVTNDRVTGWIHKGQVRPQFAFDVRRLQGIAKKRLEDARLLHREGWLFFKRDDFVTAEIRWRQAAELTKQSVGNGPTLAQIYSDLGYRFLQDFKTDDAQDWLSRAQQSLAAAGRTDHPVSAEILNNQSMVYSNQGQIQSAITALQNAIEIVKQSYGEEHSDTIVLTANLAFQYIAAGQNQQAQPHWKDYIRLATAVFGADSKEVSLGKLQYGATLITAGQFRRARRYLNSAMRLREQHGADANELAEAYAYTGLMYMGLEKWTKARQFLLKALHTADKDLYESRIAMSAHLALAKIFAGESKLFDALSAMEHLQKGITLMEKYSGDIAYVQQLRSSQAQMTSLARKQFSALNETFDDPQMVVVFDTTTIKTKNKIIATVPSGTRLWCYKAQGDWLLVKAKGSNSRGYIRKGSAASLQQNSMLSLINRLGPEGKKAFSNLVATEQKRIELEKAGSGKDGLRLLENALKKFDEVVTEESGFKIENQFIAAFWLQISNFQAIEGRLGESLKTLEMVAEQQLVELGDHPQLAATKMLLADRLSQIGEFRRAENECRDAIRIIDLVVGPNDSTSSIARSLLGTMLVQEGRIDVGRTFIEHAFKTETTAKRDKEYPMLLASRAMAELAMAENQIDAAVEYERKAIEIATAIDNIYDPTLMVGARIALATTLFKAGQTEQAINEITVARKLSNDELGEEHPTSIDASEKHARMLFETGEHEQAIALASQTLDLAILIGGEKSYRTNGLREVLGLALHSTQKPVEGLENLDRSFEIFSHYVRNVLSDLPVRRQLKILKSDNSLRAQALGLVLQKPDDPATVERTAEWLLNTKSIAFETAASHQRIRKILKTEYHRELFEQWITQRRQIATYSLESKEESVRKIRKERFAELVASANATASKIGSEFERLANQKSESKNVTLEEVRKHIDKDSILIEFSRLNHSKNPDQESAIKTDVYGAWIIPPQGEKDVMFVNFGNASKIDNLIASSRNIIKSAPQEISDLGEIEATKKLRDLMKPLTEKLVLPLQKSGLATKHWLISPDSQLWLLPWAALPVGENQFLIEQTSLRLLVSGRTLINRPAVVVKSNRPAIFADPDFNLGGESIQNAIREFQLDLNLAGSRSFQAELGTAARLPGTRMEAESILPRLKTYNGADPEVYLGAKSAERVFKELLSPQTLVMSTHGFFLDDQSEQTPLQRCGLLLSGCNLREQNLKHTGEDGVLTGEEIVKVDLRGTELVVLSACETGLGELQQGEGVAGLRQAFELAGARFVVATLWQIPDIETARLMSDMFAELANDQPPTLALQSAQQSRIKSRRERNGAAHPFFWSGIGLSGN